MFGLLSVLAICIMVIIVVHSLQEHPITFIVHKKIEEIRPEPKPLTPEEKKSLEEQNNVVDGMNELIKFTQEFLGGEPDAETKRQAE